MYERGAKKRTYEGQLCENISEGILYTPARTLSNKRTKISSLEIDIFGLKMMVESGLEFSILKFTELLQIYCCLVQKHLPRKAELAWQVSRYL